MGIYIYIHTYVYLQIAAQVLKKLSVGMEAKEVSQELLGRKLRPPRNAVEKQQPATTSWCELEACAGSNQEGPAIVPAQNPHSCRYPRWTLWVYAPWTQPQLP